MSAPTTDEAYNAGYDCGENGPNETNCHFTLFRTPEHTRAWEAGKRDAENRIHHRMLEQSDFDAEGA